VKPENTTKIKYGVWGLICEAIIAMIIGFAWGGGGQRLQQPKRFPKRRSWQARRRSALPNF
jgi:hypothetical protein